MNIFLIEDEEEYFEEVLGFLEHDGHTVYHVRTLEDALQALPELKNIKVVVLDGYFPNDSGKNSLFDFFGPVLAEEIKKYSPEITIIAYTTVPKEYAKYGNIHVSKNIYEEDGGGIGKLRREIGKIEQNKTPQT